MIGRQWKVAMKNQLAGREPGSIGQLHIGSAGVRQHRLRQTATARRQSSCTAKRIGPSNACRKLLREARNSSGGVRFAEDQKWGSGSVLCGLSCRFCRLPVRFRAFRRGRFGGRLFAFDLTAAALSAAARPGKSPARPSPTAGTARRDIPTRGRAKQTSADFSARSNPQTSA